MVALITLSWQEARSTLLSEVKCELKYELDSESAETPDYASPALLQYVYTIHRLTVFIVVINLAFRVDSQLQLLNGSSSSIQSIEESYQQDSNEQYEQYMVLYDGNAEVIGNFRALNFYKASDMNIKEDIRLLVEGNFFGSYFILVIIANIL